MWIVRFGRIS
jgi:hypothetical protein